MTSRLALHEWFIVSLLIISLILLICITRVSKEVPPSLSNERHELVSTLIEIEVEGAIEKCGTYFLKKGSRLKHLFQECIPLPEADLSKFKYNKKLRDGEIIRVPYQKWISIYLEGAVVQKGILKVKQGTKISDLETFIECLPNADLKVFRKKRLLKDGEIFTIPFKKEVIKNKKKNIILAVNVKLRAKYELSNYCP